MNNWKPLQEVYPQEERHYFCESDYRPLLESFGYEILIQVDESDYQGDSIVVFYDKGANRYGYLVFGWGSCSGCDALQACGSYEDIESLRDSLHDSIQWFTSYEELAKWIAKHDYEADFTGRQLVTDFLREFSELTTQRGEMDK